MDSAVASRVIDEIAKEIEATLKIPADKIDIDAPMDEIGIDSIISLELVSNLSESFGITLSPAQFAEVDTLRALAEVIEETLPEEIFETELVEPIEVSAEDAATTDVERFVEHLGLALDKPYDNAESAIEALVDSHYEQLLARYELEPEAKDDGQSDKAADALVGDIAILGIGCRLPDAEGPAQFWQNLLEKKCSVKEIPESRWRWQDYYDETPQPGKTISRWGALIDGYDCFDAEFFGIGEAEAELMDPQLRLLIQEVYNAFGDAGMPVESLAGSDTGIFVGYEYAEYEQFLRRNAGRFTQPVALSSSTTSYYLANRVSYTFDFKGPSEAININCASSAVALNRAYQALRSGECDTAVAAGVCLNLHADDYVTASQYGLLSADGSSGVFDDAASGFTRGEAIVAVVLGRADEAQRQGRRIYSLIKACGQNNRGAARSVSEVKHESITELLEQTMAKNSIEPDSIRYIEVDGYSTRWGDAFEFEGIRNAFEDTAGQGKRLALGSYKGNIGHSEPTSGLVALTKLALSMYHGCFPASITRKKPSRFIDIDNEAHGLYFADEAIRFDDIRELDQAPIRAGINSFADSGSNIHIILEEYRQPVPQTLPEQPVLLVYSAKSASALQQLLQRQLNWLGNEANQPGLNQLAYTLQTGRSHYAHRVAFSAESIEQATATLSALVKAQTSQDSIALPKGDSICYGEAQDPSAPADEAQIKQQATEGQWLAIAKSWVGGFDINFKSLWPVAQLPLSLPTYPFAAKRHWAQLQSGQQDNVSVAPQAPLAAAKAPAAKAVEVERQWYFYRSDDKPVAGALDLNSVQKAQYLLKQAIALSLGVKPQEVDGERNFLELGLTSLGIAAVVQEAAEVVGCHLSPSLLFKYPQADSLGAYLAGQYEGSLASLAVTEGPVEGAQPAALANEAVEAPPLEVLVPLKQSGKREPLFAIPGADGNVLTFQQMIAHLDDEQPLYCLEAPGKDGVNQPLDSLEQTVVVYRDAIKQLKPEGPYHILGYSNGAVAAFALAALMQSQGDEVASLSLMDGLCPTVRDYQVVEEMAALFGHLSEKLGGSAKVSAEQLSSVEPEQRPDYLYGILTEQGLDMPRSEFDSTYKVATASEDHCRNYGLKKLTKPLQAVLYRAAQSYPDKAEDYGWNEWLAQPAEVQTIAADHFTLVEGEAVVSVAEDLNKRLAEVPARAATPRGRAAAKSKAGSRKGRRR